MIVATATEAVLKKKQYSFAWGRTKVDWKVSSEYFRCLVNHTR